MFVVKRVWGRFVGRSVRDAGEGEQEESEEEPHRLAFFWTWI